MKSAIIMAMAVAATSAYAANLSKLYEKDYLIGVALPEQVTSERDTVRAEIAGAQFNCITPENIMKWDSLEPREGQFNFDAADKLVAYAQKHNMKIHGHVLVWHSQTPGWVFQGENGQRASRELVLKRMKNHIDKVLGHFKGKIDVWDVVNEAFNDNGTLRNSQWKSTIGDDFIEKAFEYARAADPSAKLVYNDYNAYMPAKRKGIAALARTLKAKNLIDAVGMQQHLHFNESLKDIEDSIVEFKSIGLKVMVTELDIDVLPSSGYVGADISQTRAYDDSLNPFQNGMSRELGKKLADRYVEIFKLYSKHKDAMYSVTIWGFDDGTSWLNNFPVRGRVNHPLLFDRDLLAKEAYDALVNQKKGK